MIKLTIDDPDVFRRALSVPWHLNLIRVHMWLAGRYGDFITSSAYREYKGGKFSVHNCNPCRGEDWYNRRWAEGYMRDIEDDINLHWQYDFERPELKVAKYHTVDPMQRGGWHMHMQVHDNTRKTR